MYNYADVELLNSVEKTSYVVGEEFQEYRCTVNMWEVHSKYFTRAHRL